MTKIKDFGNKIGGAKKDLWANRNLMVADLEDMNDMELNKFCVRNNIWTKTNEVQAILEGEDRFISYWKNEQRKNIYPKPQNKDYENYIRVIEEAKNLVESVRTYEDLQDFYKKVTSIMCNGYHIKREYGLVIKTNFFNNGSKMALDKMKRKMIKDQYGIPAKDKQKELFERTFSVVKVDNENFKVEFDTHNYLKECIRNTSGVAYGWSFYLINNDLPDNIEYALMDRVDRRAYIFTTCEEAKAYLDTFKNSTVEPKKEVKRKTKFKPKQFENVKYDGKIYLNSPSEKDWLDTFRPFGCEFGNYMSQNDRKYSMEYAFNSLCSMADTLDISYKDIFFNGQLSLAFGARGSKGSAAHYEPMRKVINLTKKSGAGSLAHEWGHALDHQIACFYGFNDTDVHFMSDSINTFKIKEFKALIDSFIYGSNGNTKFYDDSVKFDKIFSKEDHGYWYSRKELFARAFSCYIEDKTGFKDDYLFGHADSYNSGEYKAYPVGKERTKINKCFDELFTKLKKDGFFHERTNTTNEIVHSDNQGQLFFSF